MPFDPTKPCRYTDGSPARILCYDRPCGSPIVAMKESGYITLHARDGYPGRELLPTDPRMALENVPQKHTIKLWINVYEVTRRFQTRIFAAAAYTSEKAAREWDCNENTLVARFQIEKEFEEGEGL